MQLWNYITINLNSFNLFDRMNKCYTGSSFVNFNLFNSLQYILTLEVLDITNNSIGYQLSDNIAAVINSNHTFEQLWLDSNALLTKGIQFLMLCQHLIMELLHGDAAYELLAITTNNTYLEDLQLI